MQRDAGRSTARYYPFGGWRTEPTAGLTDMGYTAHRHNNLGNAPDDIGLIYMNARWYLPGLGRFISADTIVPSPSNPQSFNRYSYVYNSPLRYTDPTGHLSEDEIGDYFGYDESEALNAWGQELFDLLWDTELTWGSVFDYDGSNTMLALFETGEDTSLYRGGFWGLDGDNRGEEVWEYELKNSDDIDYNPALTELFQELGWENLPRQTGSDGYNNYDPTVYVDVVTVGTVSATASVGGLFFLTGPVGWVAAGVTVVGGGSAIYQIATDDLTISYPTLRLPTPLGNAPRTWHAFDPQGYYE